MRNTHIGTMPLTAAMFTATTVFAAPAGKEAANMKDTWVKEHLTDPKTAMPFSFTYEGQPSAKLLGEWPAKCESQRLDAQRARRTIVWTDAKTGLEVRCVAVDYADYPAVEWTVYFKNTGTNNTPILKEIQGLDAAFTRPGDGEFTLHGNKGDWCVPESFEPYRQTLAPGTTRRFAPNGGRPTNGPNGWPYYNIQWTGGGLMLAIGWPGQWAASFARDDKTSLRITAGQELTNLSLKPGEEVRSPLIALLFWRGDDVASVQNLWRRWMLAHNLPRTAGTPLKPMFFGCASGLFLPTLKTTEAIERQFIDAFVKEGITLDCWWIDAGWYPCGSWPEVGTWEVDSHRFPKGIKAVSNYVHAKDMKQILWFEPERVTGGSWIAKNQPEWVLGGQLFNIGNPDARQWLTDHVDKLMTRQGIDLYRQDFNMDPLGYWRKNDAPDRQGMTENLYIQGHLEYWDELRHRHPSLQIDSCASGGRRIDLETLRRAAGPHTRSDYIAFDGKPGHESGNQGQTFGLSSWLPYYGQGVYYRDQTRPQRIYNVRSYMGPAFGICVDVRRADVDWDLYRRLVDQWRQVAPCMLGDYYPLTSYSLQLDQWIAWQFDRPEEGDGVVQAFRRERCEAASQAYRLRGLDQAASYEITNFDAKGSIRSSGKDLMEKGLTVEIPDKPGAAVIVYRRVQQ